MDSQSVETLKRDCAGELDGVLASMEALQGRVSQMLDARKLTPGSELAYDFLSDIMGTIDERARAVWLVGNPQDTEDPTVDCELDCETSPLVHPDDGRPILSVLLQAEIVVDVEAGGDGDGSLKGAADELAKSLHRVPEILPATSCVWSSELAVYSNVEDANDSYMTWQAPESGVLFYEQDGAVSC